MMISVKLGLRNLSRNRWRSGLTLAAVAVAVGLMVWTMGFYGGWIDEMVRGATSVETGQIQIHVTRDALGDETYQDFKTWDVGDIVAAEGVLFKTKRGELK